MFAKLMIVSAASLKKTPVAFQEYVKKYFLERKILGRKCWVATTQLHSGRWGDGIAPRHMSDLREFQSGLEKGTCLNDWIKAHEGKLLWRFDCPSDYQPDALDD